MRLKNKQDIVLPLDGSEASIAALGAAKALARSLGGTLHIVHVVEGKGMSRKELLDYLGIRGDFPYDIRRLKGEIVPAILSYALEKEARLIVMSSHGETFNDQELLGSKARGIAQHTMIPILIIRSGMKEPVGEDWHPHKILAPLDGTALPDYVTDAIFEVAELLHADIDVLNVAVSGREAPSGRGAMPSSKYLDHPYYDWPAWGSEFINRLLEQRHPDVELNLFQKGGDPVEVALEFSAGNDDDIIALNWRGRMSKKHAEMVKGILRETERPVLLIRRL
jgi:nucleotide-binding universal stress UspA family protein